MDKDERIGELERRVTVLDEDIIKLLKLVHQIAGSLNELIDKGETLFNLGFGRIPKK